MLHGDPDFFTLAHYENSKGTAPAPLCELVVHCLELVSQLSASGLAYRFKGGNSLLILLEDPRRFSIDVDIVTTVSKETLSGIVEQVTESCPRFTGLEIRPHKTKPWLPMISYNIRFDSVYGGEACVMLDAVLEEPPYPGIRKQVRCGTLYHSAQTVEVPSVSGLTADKFLTLGPATLGIPLDKGKDAQRLKHVFDVALLLREKHDPQAVRGHLEACLAQENSLQRSGYTLAEVVADTLRFLTAPQGSTGPEEALAKGAQDPYLREIATGFEKFRGHLFRQLYTWDDLKADCALIAGLCGELA